MMGQWATQAYLNESGPPAVRDAPGLAGLPAEERRLRQALWADVAAAGPRDAACVSHNGYEMVRRVTAWLIPV